ncbi:hypothetical protein [Umezawaea sp. Da 62-37]|uniref:hypothetical protein n=1 Tax=Umezawaea sp. Da 62-37 TaxID=3075927 RepID=UPI0028F71451|nr:hypothetical protein [Umezawaea sp. Da 62-37]WNV90283.1 hypothetical protein RM788_18955 [Umezawaea sp. Da 62-37]
MSQLKEFAVKLWDGEDGTTVYPLAYDADQAELLARLIVGSWGHSARMEILGCRPLCDYCDGLATRVERGTLVPLCKKHAKAHYGSEWRGETQHLGDKHFLALDEVALVGAEH